MNITITVPDSIAHLVPDAEQIAADAIADAAERRVMQQAAEAENVARRDALAAITAEVAPMRARAEPEPDEPVRARDVEGRT